VKVGLRDDTDRGPVSSSDEPIRTEGKGFDVRFGGGGVLTGSRVRTSLRRIRKKMGW